MTPRTGRPPLPDPREHIYRIRLNNAEKAIAEQVTELTGDDEGVWMRNAVIAAGKRRLANAKRAASKQEPAPAKRAAQRKESQ